MSQRTIAKPAAPQAPTPARVRAEHGTPVAVAGVRVEEVREFWIVQDRWWTEQPIHRHYWELITAAGANVVVFHDLVTDGWFTQAA
jgi:isopentenyl diphosphate isomerase/L-lactate dehydrogenase-like FMN-dependent dehydrogenase